MRSKIIVHLAKRTSQIMKNGQDVNIQMRSGTKTIAVGIRPRDRVSGLCCDIYGVITREVLVMFRRAPSITAPYVYVHTVRRRWEPF